MVFTNLRFEPGGVPRRQERHAKSEDHGNGRCLPQAPAQLNVYVVELLFFLEVVARHHLTDLVRQLSDHLSLLDHLRMKQ